MPPPMSGSEICLKRSPSRPVDGDWHTRTTRSADPGEAKGFSEGRPLATERAGGGAEVDGHPFQPSLSQVPPGAWALAPAQPPGPPQPQALHSTPSSPGDGSCVEPSIDNSTDR